MEQIIADFPTINTLFSSSLSPHPTYLTITFSDHIAIPILSKSSYMQDCKEEEMETELAKCECCGFKEDCTQDYITEVKSEFLGKWLCGLCSEAVKDEQ
ncbi:hypothetical protein ACET3Z_032577 [Daucus carota]